MPRGVSSDRERAGLLRDGLKTNRAAAGGTPQGRPATKVLATERQALQARGVPGPPGLRRLQAPQAPQARGLREPGPRRLQAPQAPRGLRGPGLRRLRAPQVPQVRQESRPQVRQARQASRSPARQARQESRPPARQARQESRPRVRQACRPPEPQAYPPPLQRASRPPLQRASRPRARQACPPPARQVQALWPGAAQSSAGGTGVSAAGTAAAPLSGIRRSRPFLRPGRNSPGESARGCAWHNPLHGSCTQPHNIRRKRVFNRNSEGRLPGRDRRFWHAEPLICHSEEPAAAGDEVSRLVGAPHGEILRSLRSLRMTTWAACDEKRSHPPIPSPGS